MRSRIIVALKGACMGFADAIPGVSGGTMALMLGIYERFIAALGAIGPAMLPMLLQGAFWRQVFADLGPTAPPRATEPVGIAAQHVAFLINVVVGVLAGVLVGIAVLPVLMDRFPEAMRGFFLGLVLASVVVPLRMVRQRNTTVVLILVISAGLTFALMGLQKSISGFAEGRVVLSTANGVPLTKDLEIEAIRVKFATSTGQKKLRREKAFQPKADLTLAAGESSWTLDVVASQGGALSNLPPGSLVQVVDAKEQAVMGGLKVSQPAATSGGTDPALWYIFICGAIAISAMLLPGVSGSFLLLMMGLYGYILHSARALIYTQDTSLIPVIGLFLLGIILGILSFSRFLRWLLDKAHDATMAFLAGLMLGSLRALWPFQRGVGKLTTNVMPESFDSIVLASAATFLFGVLLVTAFTVYGARTTTDA